MSRIANADPEDAPSVLLVDNNEMTLMRLKEIFRQRDFHVIECNDGDKAVDEYILHNPELVIIALDIPTLDGHLAALEMREHGGDSRIIFSSPRRLTELSTQAMHSAGAVAVVEKPITKSVIDDIWDAVLGPIPEAPGLEDMDKLYPDDELQIEEIETELQLLPPPLPILPALPVEEIVVVYNSSKPKKKKRKYFFLLIVLSGIGFLASAYFGLTSI